MNKNILKKMLIATFLISQISFDTNVFAMEQEQDPKKNARQKHDHDGEDDSLDPNKKLRKDYSEQKEALAKSTQGEKSMEEDEASDSDDKEKTGHLVLCSEEEIEEYLATKKEDIEEEVSCEQQSTEESVANSGQVIGQALHLVGMPGLRATSSALAAAAETIAATEAGFDAEGLDLLAEEVFAALRQEDVAGQQSVESSAATPAEKIKQVLPLAEQPGLYVNFIARPLDAVGAKINEHYRIIKGKKGHCILCQKDCGNIHEHMSGHHFPIYECLICGKRFGRKYKCLSHIKLDHSDGNQHGAPASEAVAAAPAIYVEKKDKK